MNLNRHIRKLASGGLLLFVLITACAINPVSGKKQLAFMSEAEEIALGAESDPQVIAEFGLYDDPALQQFIDARGQEMVAVSHRPGLKFHFRILDSPVVNAFAVPGGYVYFTRGIMGYFNNEAEFAGVLGHEIGHITARHGVDQYTKSLIAEVLLVGGMAVSKDFRAFANEAQIGMQLLMLKYSRDHESQADQLGVEYSTKVDYDAREMATFFKTLKWLSDDSGAGIPTFLSTHPDPADRLESVAAAAADWQVKAPMPSYKVNRDSYLRMIDGIVFGEDPRQGYVLEQVFYHPVLKFQYPVPKDWALENSPSQVQMAPADGKALMILGLANGSDLQTAATTTSKELQLTVTSSRQVNVNGLKGQEVLSFQASVDPATGDSTSVKVQSLYIQYGQEIYVFHGVSTFADFARYKPEFDKTMYGFRELKDPARINVVPERIRVVPVKSKGTLGQALLAYGVATGRHRELAIVNGMDITDQVEAGSLIKIVTRDSDFRP